MPHVTIERPSLIRQSISAGGNYDGSEPASAPAANYDGYRFSPEAAGGLFDFSNSDKYNYEEFDAQWLVGIELALGTQSAWSIKVVDSDGNARLLASGTTESSFIRGAENPIMLLWGEQVKVETTGATGPLVATVKLAPHLMYT